MSTQENFQDMWTGWRDAMVDTWSKAAGEVAGSDAFFQAMTASTDWYLANQRRAREMSGAFMEAMEMPKRSDIARLAQHIQAVEGKVMDLQERLDDVLTGLDRIEKAVKSSKTQPKTKEKS